MCHLFAHQPRRNYQSQTRSLRIGGHCTSIRLETAFWATLEEIAAKESMSLPQFLTALHGEVLEHHGEVNNFTSLLRCCCLLYRSGTGGATEDPVAPITTLSSKRLPLPSALERQPQSELLPSVAPR